jgi:hypothetical protein
MFSYVVDFTHQPFSILTFSTTIEIVSDFLPKKNEVENAQHTQSCWLVALFLHYAVACKSVSCHIARSDNIKHIFSLYHKEASNYLTIVICKLSIARINNNNNCIFDVVLQ